MRILIACTLMLFTLILPAQAEKAPAVLAVGSGAAACHLATHAQAYTHNWDGTFIEQPDGTLVSPLADDDCKDYGHVHCYGQRVTMWDTPMKGPNNAVYKKYTKVGELNPDDAFQLVDVCMYRNRFYAMVRLYKDDKYAVGSGWVNADYIGCDCTDYDKVEEIPVYNSYEYFFAEPEK